MKTAHNITLVSLLAAGVLSVPAYAHTHDNWLDRSAVKATITFTEPNQHGFDFAATTAAGADYAYFVGVKEKLDWAIGLEHKLQNGVSRLFFDYDHFEASETSSLLGPQKNILNIPSLHSVGSYDVDADSLKFGSRHRLEFGPMYSVDLGAALSWIDVDRDFTITHTEGVTHELRQEADFEAIGPYFDASTKYYTHSKKKQGLNLQAYVGGGLLYSETKFIAKRVDAGVPGAVFDREKVKGVSTEMMAKLAIGWDHCFSNKTVLSTSLGYMMKHYTEAFDYGALGGAVASAAREDQSGDFGPYPFTRQGPFLEFRYGGMHS